MRFEAGNEAIASIVLEISEKDRSIDSCFGVVVLAVDIDSPGVTSPLKVTVLSRLKIGLLDGGGGDVIP